MGLSPMMQHYLQVKEKHQDCIVFYRLGDFYEMFFDDAIKASSLLELTLTGRDCGLEERAPMCGVPFHAAKIYIARLLRLGKHVAICEQVTPPSKGKGLTERKVIEVISPGNTVEQEYLDQGANNFLASLCFVKDYVSFSYIDISTGEFYALSWLKSQNQIELSKELGRVLPRELILPISLQRDEDVNFVLNHEFDNPYYLSIYIRVIFHILHLDI
jgi:DNA mismatch repair protein MutS